MDLLLENETLMRSLLIKSIFQTITSMDMSFHFMNFDCRNYCDNIDPSLWP